jgi:hypothetical protein
VFSLERADLKLIIGFAITDITFSNSGGAIASCTVARTLPAELLKVISVTT